MGDWEKTALASCIGLFQFIWLWFALNFSLGIFWRVVDFIHSAVRAIFGWWIWTISWYFSKAHQHKSNTYETSCHHFAMSISLLNWKSRNSSPIQSATSVRSSFLDSWHYHNMQLTVSATKSSSRNNSELWKFLDLCHIFQRFVPAWEKRSTVKPRIPGKSSNAVQAVIGEGFPITDTAR